MNTLYNYAREKLLLSVNILATSQGDVRSRLLEAYAEFHPLRKKHFPESLKKEWEWIDHSLTKFAPVYDASGEVTANAIENTLKRIKNTTGKKIAEKIFQLFYELHFNEAY